MKRQLLGSRKKFMAFLAIIVGGGLALLAWYAKIIIDHAGLIIDYIFASGAESFYHISSVSGYGLTKNL